MGFVMRWVAAFALLAATYNPSTVNYLRWVADGWPDGMPLMVLAGLVLVAGHLVFLTAVLRGIGAFGAVLILAIAGALVWVMVDFGWIDVRDPSAMTWLVLLSISLMLAAGMYWGILWRRISGQVEVDDEGDGA